MLGLATLGMHGHTRAMMQHKSCRVSAIGASALLGGYTSLNTGLSSVIADHLPRWPGGLWQYAPPRATNPSCIARIETQEKQLAGDSVPTAAESQATCNDNMNN
jgi:hypothetical protein